MPPFASPVPAYTICGFWGSMATAPIAREGCPSNLGLQVVPPSVVFHTPPGAVAMYTPRASVVSVAMSFTRPDQGGGPGQHPCCRPVIGRGPIEVQGTGTTAFGPGGAKGRR